MGIGTDCMRLKVELKGAMFSFKPAEFVFDFFANGNAMQMDYP